MKELWSKCSVDKLFVKYFPDTFLLRVPPAEYFWKVFAAVKKKEFDELLKGKLAEMKSQNKIRNEKLTLTPEAVQILKNSDFEKNLALLRMIISCQNR